MTPEERAKAVAASLAAVKPTHIELLRERGQPVMLRVEYGGAVALIASAIREAENAALERAEQDIRLHAITAYGQGQDGSDDAWAFGDGLAVASDRIREMRCEVLERSVQSVIDATNAYLPPDGISAQECISRVLAATDNPEVANALASDRIKSMKGESA